MNIKSLGNFLIKKTTGEIFSEVGSSFDDNQVYIQRLGDIRNKTLSKRTIENDYYLIDKEIENESWKNIAIFIKKEIEKYDPFEYVFIFSSEKDIIVPTLIRELDDPLYVQLENEIEKLASANLMEIKSFKDEDKIEKSEDRIKTRTVRRKAKNILDEEKSEDQAQFIIIDPDPLNDQLDKIILHDVTKDTIKQVLVHHELKDFFTSEWSSDRINKTMRTALNFYGPPGTGKTITVKSIANYFNKKILQVDFSSLLSKYMGDTGKNIQKYFKKAREEDLILLFDEADTLLQKRSADTSSASSSYNNQNQTIFMQELDRFDGMIILTTNLFSNFDEAQLRRFRHVEFMLPNEEMRCEIIKYHIPEKLNISENINMAELAKETVDFSGGDIKNLIENTMQNFATDLREKNKEMNTQEFINFLRKEQLGREYFLKEIYKIRKNKETYSGVSGNNRNKISLV